MAIHESNDRPVPADRRVRRGAVAGALWLALAAPTGAAPSIFPLAEVRPGLIGKATTVIAGDQLQTIDVELLGVVPDGIGPQVDLILGRLRGELGEWNGVAAGMSGSPVTIDGRLVGALSYAIGQFTKEPICGITPIEAMTTLDGYPGGARPWLQTGAAGDTTTSPFPVALAVEGLAPRIVAQLPAAFAELGWQAPLVALPAATSPGATQAPDPAQLTAGHAIAALLVWGDMKIGATGTITLNDAGRLLAFGHPFMGSGRTTIPLAPADVLWTVPALTGSFKISRIGEPIGVWEQDRLTGISGRLGDVPRGIPVTLRLQRIARPALEQRVHVIDDPYFTPVLAAIAMRGAVLEDLGAERDEALRLSAVVTLAGGRKLPITAYGAGGLAGSADGVLANELTQRLSLLTRAPIALPPIQAIEIEVSSLEPDGGFALSAARPDRLALRAGEQLQVRAALESARGERRLETLTLTVPSGTPAGMVTVLVGSPRALAGETGGLGEAQRRTARDPESYLQGLERAALQTRLEAALVVSGEGLVASGRAYPALPGSVQLLLRGRIGGGGDLFRTRWRELSRASIPLERDVSGLARLSIEVLP